MIVSGERNNCCLKDSSKNWSMGKSSRLEMISSIGDPDPGVSMEVIVGVITLSVMGVGTISGGTSVIAGEVSCVDSDLPQAARKEQIKSGTMSKCFLIGYFMMPFPFMSGLVSSITIHSTSQFSRNAHKGGYERNRKIDRLHEMVLTILVRGARYLANNIASEVIQF